MSRVVKFRLFAGGQAVLLLDGGLQLAPPLVHGEPGACGRHLLLPGGQALPLPHCPQSGGTLGSYTTRSERAPLMFLSRQERKHRILTANGHRMGKGMDTKNRLKLAKTINSGARSWCERREANKRQMLCREFLEVGHGLSLSVWEICNKKAQKASPPCGGPCGSAWPQLFLQHVLERRPQPHVAVRRGVAALLGLREQRWDHGTANLRGDWTGINSCQWSREQTSPPPPHGRSPPG